MELLLAACILLALFGLDRLSLWLESKGWIYYRRRKPSVGSIGSALLDLQRLVEPQKKALIEVMRKPATGENHSGDPPVPGLKKET